MNKEANKAFEQKIREILRGKLHGFKRYGALTGTSLGVGIGSTKGLYDAYKEHAELDDNPVEGVPSPGNLDRVKNYLKKMVIGGGVGGTIGAGLGVGGGELLRRRTAEKIRKGNIEALDAALNGKKISLNKRNNALEQMAKTFPEKNMLDETGKQMKKYI